MYLKMTNLEVPKNIRSLEVVLSMMLGSFAMVHIL
jgi:hypothetical protein